MKRKLIRQFWNGTTILLLIFCNASLTIGQENIERDDAKKIVVAGVQMHTTGSIGQHKETLIEYIKKAASEGAEILITPEGALSGYHPNFDQGELQEALSEVLEVAKDAKIGLFLGTCFYEKVHENEICYNQVRVYNADGVFLGKHSKILLCSPVDSPGTGEMHDYGQGSLTVIDWEGVDIGILICNDLWATPGYTTIPNPYLPLKLKQMGADVIFHSINSGSNQRYKNFHESSVELWAFSLEIPILEVNAVIGQEPTNARSGLINRHGERAIIAPETGEHLFLCEIEFRER